jgi:hypothetical protein
MILKKILNGVGKVYNYNDVKIYNLIRKYKNIYNFVDETDITACIIYIYRYSQNNKITDKNINDIVESSLILSNKYISDNEIIGSGSLENKILQDINWNLFINEYEYNYFNKIIDCF